MMHKAYGQDYVQAATANCFHVGLAFRVSNGKDILCGTAGYPQRFVHVGLADSSNLCHGRPLPASKGTCMVKSICVTMTNLQYGRTNAFLTHLAGPGHLLSTWSGNLQYGTVPSSSEQNGKSTSSYSASTSALPPSRSVNDDDGGADVTQSSPKKFDSTVVGSSSSQKLDLSNFTLKDGVAHGKQHFWLRPLV